MDLYLARQRHVGKNGTSFIAGLESWLWSDAALPFHAVFTSPSLAPRCFPLDSSTSWESVGAQVERAAPKSSARSLTASANAACQGRSCIVPVSSFPSGLKWLNVIFKDRLKHGKEFSVLDWYKFPTQLDLSWWFRVHVPHFSFISSLTLGGARKACPFPSRNTIS